MLALNYDIITVVNRIKGKKMTIIDEITVEDFKKFFPRYTPIYLPVYVEGSTHFKGDIVYYNELFYQCIVATTTEYPTNITDWQVINQTVLNYTQDSDIKNAMAEARVNFNEGMFPDEDTAKLVFLYLTAYYLTVDFKNAIGQSSTGVVQSKTVGSVSESYAIPQWVTNSPILSAYAQNGYGLKYLTLIRPYIIGNIYLSVGAITID